MNREQLIALAQSDAQVQSLPEWTFERLNDSLGEAFAVMKDFDQDNPHHHLDLLQHTVSVVLHLEKDGLTAEEWTLLRIAGLFHDIGKPSVAFLKGDRHVFYGHPEKSAEIGQAMLQASGFETAEIQKIRFYIANHDMFISFRLSADMPRRPTPYVKEINRDNVLAAIEAIREKVAASGGFVPSAADFDKLMRLCDADAQAQAERVVYHGQVIDSRTKKTRRIKFIWEHIQSITTI